MPPRILIVEDNDQLATTLESLLRRKGLATQRTRDGETALPLLLADPPAVLLLDLRLPGMNGIELLRHLRREPATRQLPVIIMSGVYRGDQYVQAAKALGVSHYLEKPFRTEALVEALRQLLKPAPAGLPFARHLQRALATRFTGLYRLRHPGGESCLLLAEGLPVAFSPGIRHPDLGEFLFRQGAISAEEYAYYRNGAKARPEALVQMGCVDYGQLLQAQLAYLSAELLAGFGQPPMAVHEEARTLPPGLFPVTVNLPDLLYQGVRRNPDPQADLKLLAEAGEKFALLTPGFFRQINFFSLEPEEQRLLARLDGSRTLNDGLENQKELLPLVRTLLLLEMIRFGTAPQTGAAPDFPLRTLFNAVPPVIPQEEEPLAAEKMESFADLVEETADGVEPPTAMNRGAPQETPPPSASPLGQKVRERLTAVRDKDYYQVFGLTQGRFSFDLLKERYFQVTREFGPDVLMQLSGEEASLVEEILSTVTTAYNTLSDVVKKERYDELLGSEKIGLGQQGDDRFQAEVQFQSAKVFLDMEEWASAEKALQDACTIEPNNGIYLAHLAWAIYRNPAFANSRAMLEKARQMLNRALTLERSADGFAFKGQMLLEAGQDGLAEAEFSKALKLDARQAIARSGVRQLQEKREQEKRGLLRKFFR